YILRQIEPDRDNLRHDRSPLWIVADPPWHIRCRRGAVTSSEPRADALEFMLGSGDKVDVTVCQHVRTRFDKPTRWEVSNRHVKSTLALAALENCIGWWSFGMLISREMIEKNQIRFREAVYFEDIDFNIRVFLASQSHVVTKEVLYYYIDRNDSTVNSINEKKLLDSVGAIAVVASMLSDRRAEERERFYKKASAWLQLQARRIRDCGEDKDERIALAGIFIMELKEAGLLKKLAPDLEKQILGAATAAPASSTVLGKVPDNFCFNPWLKDFACEFFERVIFFCEVDYHIRSAAPVARQLRLMGINSVIIDASRSTTFTSNRPLPDDELPLYADVDLRSFNIAETLPFATNAAAFVFMNDLTYTKRLIFENFGFGVPTFGFYEGINDDWNLDRKALRRPYRSVDYLLLPGIYQQGFYSDRETRVVGLPNVRSRLAQPYVQPTKRRAIINVNFTYGVLEDRRDLFVESAVAACTEAGLDYIITQHPADKGVLSRYNVGTDSVYSLLEEGTILISRFSTTILEALAMGRPAIYHNPIDERVPKFKFPLGAYSITDGKDALKQALESELTFLDDGGDIRKRAALFLHFHCNTGDSIDPDLLAARAIAEVVRSPGERYDFKRHVNNRVATTPQTGQVNVSVGSALDLTELAVQLLLDPQSGRARLRDEAAAIEQGLAALPENSPVRQHFQRVRAFAEAE
ncbi:hypothetical protein, partial [Paracoccus sp. MC1862]|uniref:hypothetical protein n=1 Tax=Paracoccus sp. MC1862 TaxID=2760307 RepID=UPI001C724A69